MAVGGRRIAIDARALNDPFTSNYTYWRELLLALGSAADLRFVLFGDAPEAPPEFRREPFEYRYLAARSSRWWSLVSFPLAARRRGCGLAHMQYTVSPLFRIPTVTTVHDVSYFIEPRWFSPRDAFLLRRSVPASCRRASAVIAVSESDKAELERYAAVDPTKIVVAPNGMSSFLHPIDPAKARRERPFALMVGGLSPRKNWPLAFRAIGLTPGLDLVVTGKTRDAPTAIERLRREVGEARIHLVGPVSKGDLNVLYHGAECLIHPSWHEGFGLTVLEAFGAGIPVVASNRGAIPEVAGDAAILLDPSDSPSVWAAGIQRARSQEREGLIAKGRERAKRFTWEESARIVAGVYRRILGSGGQT